MSKNRSMSSRIGTLIYRFRQFRKRDIPKNIQEDYCYIMKEIDDYGYKFEPDLYLAETEKKLQKIVDHLERNFKSKKQLRS